MPSTYLEFQNTLTTTSHLVNVYFQSQIRFEIKSTQMRKLCGAYLKKAGIKFLFNDPFALLDMFA